MQGGTTWHPPAPWCCSIRHGAPGGRRPLPAWAVCTVSLSPSPTPVRKGSHCCCPTQGRPRLHGIQTPAAQKAGPATICCKQRGLARVQHPAGDPFWKAGGGGEERRRAGCAPAAGPHTDKTPTQSNTSPWPLVPSCTAPGGRYCCRGCSCSEPAPATGSEVAASPAHSAGKEQGRQQRTHYWYSYR